MMLAFEVTRKCNIECRHCLKGTAEELDMTKNIVDSIFNSNKYKINKIEYVSFTGGEPTLNPDIVEYIINKIVENNIDIINYVHFLTNGLIYDEKIINAISKLQIYLSHREKSKNCIINYELSNDQYHRKISSELLEKYGKLSFANKDSLFPRERTIESTVNEGRAKTNNLGGTQLLTSENFKPDIKVSKHNDTVNIDNTVYIAANGNVHTECTFSYDNFDRLAFGNVQKHNIIEIFENASYI